MKNVHVISNTHWDFEWYFTVHESFIQLSYHVDEVLHALETNVIDYYVFDGQMAIIDDFLAVYPSYETRIKNLVTQQKLFIGPWYTQTDQLIIAGESIIRNLELGMNIADKLGGYLNIAYVPDPFGQGKDMPKIYNGMGLKHTVFWRGLSSNQVKQREFIWNAEDGSSVVALNIKNGYFVGGELIYDDNPEKLFQKISEGCTVDDIVLPVGGDQRYVDFNLKERIALFNKQLKNLNANLLESTYYDFFARLEKHKTLFPQVKGEFISGEVSKIHRSIYSSRYDHKYLNDKVERRMIFQLEPLMAFANKLGIPYKKELLDSIWKLLTKNHAHDSAGGCNSDKTNTIILNRYIQADQLSYSAIDYLTRKISESIDYIQVNDLVIFNTLPYNKTNIIRCKISTKSTNINILYQNNPVNFQILSSQKIYGGSIRKDTTTYAQDAYYHEHDLLIEVHLPAWNYLIYQVIEIAGKNTANIVEKSADNYIKNDFYKFEIVDGIAILTDLITNKKFTDFIKIEESGDDGDTYDYSPPANDIIEFFDFSNAKIIKTTGKLSEKLVIQGKWLFIKDLSNRTINGQKIYNDYLLEVTLDKKSKVLSLKLKISNQAKDHRVRLIVDTGIKAQFSVADTSFGFVQRPVVDNNIINWQEKGWKEEPTTIYPLLHYVNLHDDANSCSVFCKGIKEYQIIGQHYSKIALTLYRSVGFLGKPDLLRRPGIASGNEFKYVETPDSQLIKELTFKIGIELQDSFDPVATVKTFQNYAISTPYYQIQTLNRFTNTLKYFVSNPLPFKIKPANTVNLACDELVFSNLRYNPTYNGYEIRLYNPYVKQSITPQLLELPSNIEYAFVNLKGQLISQKKQANSLNLELFKPGEIKTIILFNM